MFARLKICQKCVCGRARAPDPAGELTALPRPIPKPLAVLGEWRKGEGNGREGTRREGLEEKRSQGKRAHDTAYSQYPFYSSPPLSVHLLIGGTKIHEPNFWLRL